MVAAGFSQKLPTLMLRCSPPAPGWASHAPLVSHWFKTSRPHAPSPCNPRPLSRPLASPGIPTPSPSVPPHLEAPTPLTQFLPRGGLVARLQPQPAPRSFYSHGTLRGFCQSRRSLRPSSPPPSPQFYQLGHLDCGGRRGCGVGGRAELPGRGGVGGWLLRCCRWRCPVDSQPPGGFISRRRRSRGPGRSQFQGRGRGLSSTRRPPPPPREGIHMPNRIWGARGLGQLRISCMMGRLMSLPRVSVSLCFK